jgi:hypothetical protein
MAAALQKPMAEIPAGADRLTVKKGRAYENHSMYDRDDRLAANFASGGPGKHRPGRKRKIAPWMFLILAIAMLCVAILILYKFI